MKISIEIKMERQILQTFTEKSFQCRPLYKYLPTVLDFALKSLKNGAKIMIEFDIFDHMHL